MRLQKMSPAAKSMAMSQVAPVQLPANSEFKEFVIPSKLYPIIIGENGRTIRRLEQRANCKIKAVRAADRGIPTAVVTLFGNVQLALSLIEQELRIYGASLQGHPGAPTIN